jgi:murein L,D-transpeptidase YcbB/YkuD
MHHLHAHAAVAGTLGVLVVLAARPLGEPGATGSVARAGCDARVASLIAELVDGPSARQADAFHAQDRAPIWSREGRATNAARDAVGLLGRADEHGLDPAAYDALPLAEALRTQGDAGPCDAERLAAFELRLGGAFASLLLDVHQGRARPPGTLTPHDDLTPDAVAERVRAAVAAGTIDGLDADFQPGFAQYRHLKNALARLSPAAEPDDGVRRRIGLALERLRWLPHAPPGPLVVANIPAFRLVAFRSGRDEVPALRMPIVVGRASRTRTPVFVDAISQVVFQPPWYPPASIVRNELLPAAGRDPGSLERHRFEVVAPGGASRRATGADLELVRTGRLQLRQPPGPDNPLGRVKFVFPNDYRVYMHDTPSRALFTRPRRDFSHGCIRVQDAPALARFVLEGASGLDAEAIAAALEGARTIAVPVDPPIPVYIAYTTTIARADGTVEVFDDVYGLDAAAERALRDAEALR